MKIIFLSKHVCLFSSKTYLSPIKLNETVFFPATYLLFKQEVWGDIEGFVPYFK